MKARSSCSQQETINNPDSSGLIRLHHAVQAGNAENVENLLKSGADIQYLDVNLWTPLHYAVQNENLQIIKLLLKFGADVNYLDIKSQTPLLLAVKAGNAKM